jgi:phenylpropionate dioxygenase-like ring-hydroxylating dioxygenase large terminal subunit
MPKDHSDPIADLRSNTSVSFEQARAMPTSVYTSEDFVESELKHVFSKDWYCIGRADALSKTGDYVTAELAGQPIAVLRDADHQLRAMSNVCLHRMSTLLQGRGNAKTIVCPYHAWTYNLDGKLRGAPAMSQNDAFCKDHYRLPQVRCEEWLGWVFVCLDPEAETVAVQLAEVADMIAAYDMTNYSESFYEEHVWDTNWKVLAENFMESYHLPVCHAGTIGGLSKLEI